MEKLPQIVTFSYEISRSIDFSSFEKLLTEIVSIDVCSADMTLKFSHHQYSQWIILTHCDIHRDHVVFNQKKSYTIDEFWKVFFNAKWTVNLTTRKHHPTKKLSHLRVLEKKSTVDVSKTIDLLESKKLITTRPSKCVMARDERSFCFVGSDQFYEVDAIGSNVCPHLLEKIIEIYQ